MCSSSRLAKPRAVFAALAAFAFVAMLAAGCHDNRPPAATAPTTTATAPSPDGDGLLNLSHLDDAERAPVLATLRLIERGGPFPYPRNDGVAFENRERRLPSAPRGTYREYTVPPTHGQGRGPQRLVTGRASDLWYTRDHYRTFIRLRP